jgi:hypothetical protein
MAPEIHLPAPRRLHRLGDRSHDGWTLRSNLAYGTDHSTDPPRHGWFLNPDAGVSEERWHRGRMSLIAATGQFVWVERVPRPGREPTLGVRIPAGARRWPGVPQVRFRGAIPTLAARSRFGMGTTAAYRQIRAGGEPTDPPVADVVQQWGLLELGLPNPSTATPTLFAGVDLRRGGHSGLG